MLQPSAISQKMVGSIQSVLVGSVSRKSDRQISGRTENNRVVNFAGDKKLIGQFVDVKITEAWTNSLQGELLGLSKTWQTKLEPSNEKCSDYDNRKLA